MKKLILERFWAKVNKTESCWMWMAGKSEGYGHFWVGKNVQAHKYAYEITVGEVPDGLELDHLCRNRACVRPSHLEPVTTRINCLRGNAPAARNAVVTHCPKGHPYDLLNTMYNKRGNRSCRACRNESWK